MKQFLITTYVILTFFTITSYSQTYFSDFDIKWDKEIPCKMWPLKYWKYSNIQKVVGVDDGYYVINENIIQATIFYGKEKNVLNYYGNNGDISLIPVENSIGTHKVKPFDFIKTADKIYLLSKDEKNTFLCVQEIDEKSHQLGGIKVISDIPGIKKNQELKFSYDVSPDSSNIQVAYILPYEKGKSRKCGVKVYNKDFEEIWSKEIKLPFGSEFFEITNYRVDNEGNAYFLYVDVSKDGANRECHLVQCSSQETEYYKIDPNVEFTTDAVFQFKKDGNVVIAGIYSEKEGNSIKGNNVKGFFSIEMNPLSFSVITETTHEFTKDELIKFTDQEKGKGKLFDGYGLNKLLINDNGTPILILERRYSIQRSMGANYTYFESHFDDLVVINYAINGDVNWIQKIPKNQSYNAEYLVMPVNNSLYFIYNDETPEYNPITRIQSTWRTMTAKINEDGAIEHGNFADANVTINANSCRMNSNNEWIIVAGKQVDVLMTQKNDGQIGKIVFTNKKDGLQ